MNKLVLLLLTIQISGHVFGQAQDSTRGSIPSRAELKIGAHAVRINYYAPAVRNRIIWAGLVPYGQVWVTGAHAATSVEFSSSVQIGGKEIKGGKYALFTIPGKDSWTIIINRNWEQHLADEYSESEDVVRVQAPVMESSFTCASSPNFSIDYLP